MADELPTVSLQQNLITMLCHDDTYGRLVSTIIEADLFEGDYYVIAERAVAYWKKYNKAPKHHTADLLSDILDDPHNRRAATFRRILTAMVRLSETINSEFVIDQLRDFQEVQKFKEAIHNTAEMIQSRQEMALPDVRHVWNQLIHRRGDRDFTLGSRLTDFEKVINYLEVQQSEFTTGIEVLDKRHIVPMRGASMLILGGAGRGKTWGLIHIGKQSIMQRKKVLHISLEMSEEQVMQRYYQCLFSATKREAETAVSTLRFNEKDEFVGIGEDSIEPEFTLSSPFVGEEIQQRVAAMASKLDNVVIKRFAKMTVEDLDAYMEGLKLEYGWEPDLLLLDYFGLVKVRMSDYRLSLGEAYRDWRSLLIERNVAGVTPQQSSKAGVLAQTIKPTHAAEDWSLIATSDIVLTYSSTDIEGRLGLGRMYVGKARDEEDKFGVLMTQNYKMGQFALESTYLSPNYFAEVLPELGDDAEEDDPDA